MIEGFPHLSSDRLVRPNEMRVSGEVSPSAPAAGYLSRYRMASAQVLLDESARGNHSYS